MSWKNVNLGQLVENFSVRAKDHKAETSTLEFLGVSNEDGITKSKYAAEDKAEDYKIIEKDCFAYNPYRINVGSVALLEEDIVGLISPAYVVFKPKPRSIIPRLLLMFLKSEEGLHQIKINARGTVRQALRFEDLCKIRISIPDYDEQIEFFEKIQKTENETAVVSTELSHQLDLVKQLRQSFLREAMQGKLVKQDSKDGNALDLLKEIKIEKAKLGKKEKPLPQIKNEEIPFEIPENWVWCRLGDVISISSGDGLTSSQMDQNGSIPVYGGNGINGTHNKFNINKETIVVGRVGYYCGCVHLTQKYAWVTDNAFITSYPEKYINREFLIQLLKWADLGKQQYAGSQPVISGIRVYPKLIPLPPLAEQNRIVEKLEELMKYCDELESNIKQSKEQNEKLLQQVLREALSGEIK